MIQTQQQPIVTQAINSTPVKAPHFHSQSITSQPPPIGHMPPQSKAPIGVRPSNYQNGISIPPPSAAGPQHKFQALHPQTGQRQSPQMHQLLGGQFQTAPPPLQQQFSMAPPSTTATGVQQQQQMQQPQQQQNASGGNGTGSYQTWNGGWGANSDHLNNIGDIFGQGRSFGPLGSDFGGGGQSIGGTFHSAGAVNQPPAAGVIGAPVSSIANASSQPIGAGRNQQNVSPSQSQQQRNGWPASSFNEWNPPLSGKILILINQLYYLSIQNLGRQN
jgi:hypothetical protein